VTYFHLPRIGFGTFNNWSGDWQNNRDDALTSAVSTAIDTGYRHFDCAELYTNEDTIGDALQKAQEVGKVTRSDLFLVSKAWNHHRTPNALEAAVEKSLKALKTSYLDMYLLHWPVCWTEDSVMEKGGMLQDIDGNGVIVTGVADPRGEDVALADAWRGMEALVDKGLVRQIGVSNFGIKRLSRILETCRIRPACNQVECHPHLAQKELREFCQKNCIDFVSYHTIGKPNHRKEGEPVAIQEPVVLGIAERLGCTPSQVVLSWHLQHDVVVIPKSITPARIIENYEALKVKLSDSDVAAIDALDQGLHFCTPPWMPNWD
jgi:diketogulonate reductase-like aldo/keto reductase